MNWSISISKVFSSCPRKWAYYQIAHWQPSNPFKRGLYLLKQLKSIYAWRGSIVDTVIENNVVPRLRSGIIPEKDEIIEHSRRLVEQQLEFGLQSRHKEPGMTKTKGGDDYCAFYDIEYGDKLNADKLQVAKTDIELALTNLLDSDILQEISTKRCHLISQRRITTKFDGMTVISVPDLIVFYDDGPPMIIDWKVHAYRNTDYGLQLGIYGYVLSKSKPHRDFPVRAMQHCGKACDMRLIEFQLLRNQVKTYTLCDSDICDIEDYIHSSGEKMQYLSQISGMDLNQFPTTNFSNTCLPCQFKKVCWEVLDYEKD